MEQVRLGRFPPAEGQLARLALEQEAIPVEVRGEQRSVLQGVVPPSDAMMELWVAAEHLDRARRLLSTMLKENEPGEVRCAACGAISPAHFGACWSCEAPLHDATKLAPSVPPPKQQRSKPVFAWLFAIIALGLAGLLWKERQQAKYLGSRTMNWNWVSASCLELQVLGRKASLSCDFNHDGNFEQIETFDREGRLVSRSYDSNEDGAHERVDTFDTKGELVDRSFDLDGDQRFERSDAFDRQGHPHSRTTDINMDGRFERSEYFDAAGAITHREEELERYPPTDTWLFAARELRIRYLGEPARIAELTITEDGGVVGEQLLSIEGCGDRK